MFIHSHPQVFTGALAIVDVLSLAAAQRGLGGIGTEAHAATEAQVLCPEAINFPPEKSSPALEMILSHIAYVVKVLSTAMLVTLIDEAAQECSLKRLHERFFATVQSEFVPNGTREWPYDAFSAHFEKSVYDFVSHDVVRSTFDVYLSQNEPSAYAAQEALCDSHPGFAEVPLGLGERKLWWCEAGEAGQGRERRPADVGRREQRRCAQR